MNPAGVVRLKPEATGEFDPLDDLAAAHLEDLHHGAGRPQFQAECVAVAQGGAGHLLLPPLQGLDRPDGVAHLGGLLVALVEGGLAHPLAERLEQLVVAPLEKQPRVLHGDAVLVV